MLECCQKSRASNRQKNVNASSTVPAQGSAFARRKSKIYGKRRKEDPAAGWSAVVAGTGSRAHQHGLHLSGVQSSSLSGTLCSAFGLGVILYELGERLPIWNNYIGGGLLMAFFGTALLKFFNIIPEKTLENINRVISGDDVNLLEVYIIFLIAGSVLALDKDILLKSFVGYIPAILGGLAVATLFGVLAGLAVGVDPQTTIMKYVLPIMGGGNGAGAVPLSNIYETVTGDAAANFYGFAIIILTIGNIFAIIGSALLNTLGEKFPFLTGDKKTIVRGGEHLAREDKKVVCTMQDELGAVVLTLGCYGVGRLMSKVILPKIAGASIHAYAYMIIFVVILAASGIIRRVSAPVQSGCRTLWVPLWAWSSWSVWARILILPSCSVS